jgi:hypothetical protein
MTGKGMGSDSKKDAPFWVRNYDVPPDEAPPIKMEVRACGRQQGKQQRQQQQQERQLVQQQQQQSSATATAAGVEAHVAASSSNSVAALLQRCWV